MRRSHAGLGVAGGAVVGGFVYRFVLADVGLAVALAVVYAVAVALTLHHWRVNPSGATGSRWAAGATGLSLFAALVGVGPSLPLSADLAFALQLLVLGVGLASLQLGVGMTRSMDR